MTKPNWKDIAETYRRKRITKAVLQSPELDHYAKSIGASFILVGTGKGRTGVNAVDIFGNPIQCQQVKAWIANRIQTLEASTDDFTTKKDK